MTKYNVQFILKIKISVKMKCNTIMETINTFTNQMWNIVVQSQVLTTKILRAILRIRLYLFFKLQYNLILYQFLYYHISTALANIICYGLK